jgi:hypothetical protein
MRKDIISRVVGCLLLGFLIAVIISEVSFRTQPNLSRPPKTVDLVIPNGTSVLVAQGDQSTAIPARMTFVTGDTLIVRNEDVVSHQLGPLWIPAGSSASLSLTQTGNFIDQCSFRSSKYLNLDVHEPLTLGIRLEGILLAGIPLGILLALYALVAWPLKK